MQRIYDVCHWNDLRWCDTLHTKFHDGQFRNASNIKGYYLKNGRGCSLVVLIEGFFNHAVKMASYGMVYIPVLIMIGSGIRAILRAIPQRFERT
jgi:hypothetical protein